MASNSQKYLRRLARFSKWAVRVCIVLFGIRYCLEARERFITVRHLDGGWNEVSTDPNHQYTAKLYSIDRGTVLLRLYKTGAPTLLAERTFRWGNRFVWAKEELVYDASDDSWLGGGIQLPPTRLDRLLAKLP